MGVVGQGVGQEAGKGVGFMVEVEACPAVAVPVIPRQVATIVTLTETPRNLLGETGICREDLSLILFENSNVILYLQKL